MRLEDLAPTPGAQDRFRDRFWSKVDARGEAECWEWQASTAPHGKARLGYGRFGVKPDGKKSRVMTAHRVVYLLAYGETPDALFVCHTCDNPPCCNPAHLFLGTGKENADDRDNKGRYVSGAKRVGVDSPHAKFTEEDVREIRRLSATLNTYEIARLYGVYNTTIGNLLRGKTYRGVT